MKKIILSFLSVILVTSVFGQDITKQTIIESKPKMDNVVQPLFVLQADDKTVTLDNKKPEGGSIIDDIDPNQIETIEVLKDANAVAKYGEAARNGVIVIRFRDFNTLNFKTKALFEKVESIKKEG